jgi:hypothetical protein
MIIQLPNGRIIECSVEQYLSLSDQEIKDLNGLSSAYTKEVGDPFYNSLSKLSKIEKDIIPSKKQDDNEIHEYEPGLDEIEAFEKLDDPYFHSDDI